MFFHKFLYLFLFNFIRCIYEIYRNIKWRISGLHTRLQRNKMKQPLNHEVAQIEGIIYRYRADLIVQPTGIDNFITVHEGFVDPAYILSPNVTLYAIHNKEAIFVETDEDIDVHNMDNSGAFLMLSQFLHARRVVRLPLWAFIGMAEKIGKPKRDIVFLTNTTRCGSTLLMQVLEATKKCLIISEPGTIGISLLECSKYQGIPKDQLFTYVVNILCKPVKYDIGKYVIKLAPIGISNVPAAFDSFPKAKYLFLYRKGNGVVKSWCKAIVETPYICLLGFITSLSKSAYNGAAKCLGLEGLLPQKRFSYYELFVITWAATIRSYMKLREKGFNIHSIRYEDMINDTDFALRQIFNYINLEYDHDIVQHQFGQDSQRYTPYSHDNLNKQGPYVSLHFTQNIKKDFEVISKALGVPSVMEDIVLPGTITQRET